MFASQDPNEPAPNAISAVKALQIASAEGQRIYQINQANMATALPNIHHDQETMDEIRASLNAGKEVITHASSVSVPGWSGAGYIILDPDTGAGAYKISGGANGSFLTGLFFGIALGALIVFELVTMGPLGFEIVASTIHGFLAAALGMMIATSTAESADADLSCFFGGLLLGIGLGIGIALAATGGVGIAAAATSIMSIGLIVKDVVGSFLPGAGSCLGY